MTDAVVSVLVESLVTALLSNGRILTEFQDQFEEMKRQLTLIQGFLKDADRMRRKNHTLRATTDNLIELVYAAEDILAVCQYRITKEKDLPFNFLMCISPRQINFRFRVGRRLKEINTKIKLIKEDLTSYLSPALVIQNGENQFSSDTKKWSSPIFDRSQVVGLDDAVCKIKGWLFEESDGLNAIGIVGMGGLGKTTTAQKVLDDKNVEDYFEKRMWVSVSQTFKEEEIMRSMLKYLGDAGTGDNEGELLRKIHYYLLGKSYLIVFDDVWSLRNGWWARLRDGLPKRMGSCVLITTRIEDVAQEMGADKKRIHRPKLLTKEESWSLFCRIAFVSNGGIPLDKLNDVGMEIVEKCGGLPLAIKAVGGMMSFKPSSLAEWRRIADNFRDELAQNNDNVTASLQLSYDELPPHLKRCFLCLAIYPEDCIISKDQLIHWWIGEGFVPANVGRLLVESAENCFTGLINRCLVEVVDESYSGKVYTCKIHDMVRDLVTKLASEETFFTLNDGGFRRGSLESIIHGQRFKSNKKLRALISTTNTGQVNTVGSELISKVCDCRRLRVLDISESVFEANFKDLLSQIGSLKLLVFLCLRSIHPLVQVPYSVGELTNLQVLDLSFCHNMRFLPTSILSLEKLIILDVSFCGSLEYFPKGLGKLINIQVLKGFKPSQEGCRMKELKSLSKLRTLEMLITRHDQVAGDELDVLSSLQKLQDLTISCFNSNDVKLSVKLGRLSLPRHLHELSLKYFPCKSTPSWLNPVSLPELEYIHLSNGRFTSFDQTFWGTESLVWSVHGLKLEALPDLEGDWGMVKRAMPSLRLLNVSWCPKLETFPIADIGFKGGALWREEGRWW